MSIWVHKKENIHTEKMPNSLIYVFFVYFSFRCNYWYMCTFFLSENTFFSLLSTNKYHFMIYEKE